METDNRGYIEYWRNKTNSHTTIDLELGTIKLNIPYYVFNPSPELTYSTSLLLENIPQSLEGRKVMDMGTGTGIIAIQSEKSGSKNVLAVDIHKLSAINCRNNAKKNNCKSITVLFSDLFNNIVGGEFDFIFANLPILDVDFDEIYLRLLNQYENFLNEKGELWVVFASFGDMNSASRFFDSHPKLINKITLSKLNVDWFIYKFNK